MNIKQLTGVFKMRKFIFFSLLVIFTIWFSLKKWEEGRPLRIANRELKERQHIESSIAKAKLREAKKPPLSVPVKLNPGEKITIKTNGDDFKFISADNAMWYLQITTRNGTKVSPYTKELESFDFENHNWCRINELNAYDISEITIWNPLVFKNKGLFLGDRKATTLSMAVEFPYRRK